LIFINKPLENCQCTCRAGSAKVRALSIAQEKSNID